MTTDIEYIQRLLLGVSLEVKPWPNQGICLAVTLHSAKMKAGELVISVACINLCAPCMGWSFGVNNPLVCSFLQKTISPSQPSWVPFSSLSRIEVLWAFPLLFNIFRQEFCYVSDLLIFLPQLPKYWHEKGCPISSRCALFWRLRSNSNLFLCQGVGEKGAVVRAKSLVSKRYRGQ